MKEKSSKQIKSIYFMERHPLDYIRYDMYFISMQVLSSVNWMKMFSPAGFKIN